MGEGTPFACGKKGPLPSNSPLPHYPSFPKTRTYKFKKTGMLHEGWIFPCMELFTMSI